MKAVKRRLPSGLLGALTSIGAGIGYLVVRSEADRIAGELNAALVESLAYVDRRLDDLDARLGASAAGAARPEVGYVISALAGLPAGATVVLESDFDEAAARLRWLGFDVLAEAELPSALVVRGSARSVPALSGARLIFLSEGSRRSPEAWSGLLDGWRIQSIRELASDGACGWRTPEPEDADVLTMITADA